MGEAISIRLSRNHTICSAPVLQEGRGSEIHGRANTTLVEMRSLNMHDKTHADSSLRAASLESVEGFNSALPRTSLTDAKGTLRLDRIDGVQYRLARPVSHHHGHLTEAFRMDWGLADAPVVQVNVTVTFPGRIRAWGIHRFTVDRLFAATGSLCIVCYDGRRDSATFGCVNEFMLGERNQGLVVIPPGVYHGWKNIGDDEASIVSMPSQLYEYEKPDRWELPWDSPAARETIAYRWP